VTILTPVGDPHAGKLQLARADVAHLDVLPFERDGMERLAGNVVQQLVRRRVVQQPAGTPDRRLLAEADRREVGEPGDVVEVKVRQQDVDPGDAGQQRWPLDEPADAAAGVDDDRVFPPAQERACGVSSVGGEPATAAENAQHVNNPMGCA